ncbi:MAG: hypothetical protein ACD_16C00248G0019 [uncultured bacterium]|nr:MAG: hypothetical protein ACD_16C00248G0019 [uncultured bacterium]HBG34545.1 hypothetical protein [Holosporales bacterium]HBW24462.1 hypothetical protein [Holosporales bacterium]HCC25240.1 hypothetical protein [Holosporales bacterium]HCE96152.1 hypothetical protein [Holosporales bacterium]
MTQSSKISDQISEQKTWRKKFAKGTLLFGIFWLSGECNPLNAPTLAVTSNSVSNVERQEPLPTHTNPNVEWRLQPFQSASVSHTVDSNTSLNTGWRLQTSFFQKHAEGWHWYREQKPEISDQLSEKKEKRNPSQLIEEQRKDLEKKLHAAIIEPTREKIIAYILAQKVLMDQSERFSESWKRVVMTTPSLDETLIHPVDQNARHVYYQEKNQEITKRIKALAQDYGLFFFFKGECSYCHHFAPVVKHFAKKHGWSVLAVSLDGGRLEEFPGARRDNGIAARLQVSHVPALIAFHSSSGQMIPLAYGMVSESEIEERIDLLTRTVTSEGVKK